MVDALDQIGERTSQTIQTRVRSARRGGIFHVIPLALSVVFARLSLASPR